MSHPYESKKRIAKKKFATMKEVNDAQAKSWDWHIRINGNVKELKEFEKWIKEEKYRECYHFAWTNIPEHELDVLEKHGDSDIYSKHIKLDGKFVWKRAVEKLVEKEANNEIAIHFMENAGKDPSKNKKYFVPSDIKPQKYAIFQFWDNRYLPRKTTAIQTNGNEVEIKAFIEVVKRIVSDSKFQKFYVRIENQPSPNYCVLDGKFNFIEAVLRLKLEKRNEYIENSLYGGGIQKYVEGIEVQE